MLDGEIWLNGFPDLSTLSSNFINFSKGQELLHSRRGGMDWSMETNRWLGQD